MKYMVVFVLCKNGVVRKDQGAFLAAAKKDSRGSIIELISHHIFK